MSVVESTESEATQNQQATKSLIESATDCKEEQEDQEYDPNNEADQEQAVKDADDDIYDDDDNKDNGDENEEYEEDEDAIINSEKFENEFCAAIESIQIAAKFDREKMLENARNAYEQETGEEATDEMIVNALKAFVFDKEDVDDDEEEEDADYDPNDDQEQEQNDVDEDEDEEEENDVDDEEEEENEDEVDVEQFENEMNLALDNVIKLGAQHQEEFVNKISATYAEYNGVEPTVNDLAALFGRIKEKFADEAADDFLECNEPENDDDADSDYDPNDAEDVQQGQDDQDEDFNDDEDEEDAEDSEQDQDEDVEQNENIDASNQ